MLRYTVKKREDLRIVIEYLEGKITGDEVIVMHNAQVELARRKERVRAPSLPFTRAEGIRMPKLNARRARAAYAADVNPAIQGQIRTDHFGRKLGHFRLSKKYGYSTSVIRRILGAK